MTTPSTPNPGSDEAIKQGCTCPVIDNAHGRGVGDLGPDEPPMFWMSSGCPIHSVSEPDNKTDNTADGDVVA